jgi:hypothetical protein
LKIAKLRHATRNARATRFMAMSNNWPPINWAIIRVEPTYDEDLERCDRLVLALADGLGCQLAFLASSCIVWRRRSDEIHICTRHELSMQRKSSHTETANGELVMVLSELLSNANSATTIYGD